MQRASANASVALIDVQLNSIIAFLNDFADRDATWSPFQYLRPEKHESISILHLAKISLYFGLSYGAVYAILSILVKEDIEFLNLLLFPILAVPLYGFAFGIFLMIPWNIRARRLRSQGQIGT